MSVSRKKPIDSTAASPMRWITQAALVLALAVVIARFTTTDSLRDPWEVSPGSPPIPAAPRPAAALVFDLLACGAALLVLVRQAVDRSFPIAVRPSHLLLFGLAGWMVLSTAWSADRFAAAVSSAHFLSAACLFWAISQLVRSPLQFRMVSAIAFGLLVVLAVQSALYRFMDVPANIAYWNANKTELLKEHDWQPDSFSARQFEHKLISGEMAGFFNSANTFAAAGVLLFFNCAGIGFQKWRDRESANWLLLPIVAAVSLIWILVCARSKTAAATPVLGVAILGIFYLLRRQFTPQNHARNFGIAIGGVFLAILAVAGHGLYHHGLFAGHFSNSLDFRWKYWVASAGIFAAHPIIGVGWNNYGYYYLAHRLPEAAEEIKDPHSFLVRFFVELGIVGGLLCVAWLLRLAWEITRPGACEENRATAGPMTIRTVPVIVILGMLLSIVATTDFSMQLADLLALLLKPLLFLLALLLGSMAAAMLNQHSWSLDNRPAPLIFYSAVTGLGLFLLHNLIDFSWFEVGPMFLFMALLGSAQGLAGDAAKPNASRWPLAIGAVAAIGLWIAVAALFVAPIIMAEQSSADANELIRTAPTSPSPEADAHFHEAAQELDQAGKLVPYDSDYAYRQAELCLRTGDVPQAKTLLARAKQINPISIDAYLLDANLQLSQPFPDSSIVQSDFTKILQLNPNDVSLRIQFGNALHTLGLIPQAREQYRLALQANNALPPDEPKRLTPNQVADLQRKL